MEAVGLLIVGIGLFSLGGAIFNWNWFLSNWRAKPFVRIFGRDGTRLFYGLLGVVFIVIGVLIMEGIIR
jgi:hypothetical protein